ncbi:transposase IS4 family protein [Alicyclobacillus hesperidum URH17-3-68]|nr:transposase IS4 family protein [Alicyclobacillus hesperidum URH17-3-68]
MWLQVHLAVDAKSELPMALTVTPANVYDGEMAIPSWKSFITTTGGFASC